MVSSSSLTRATSLVAGLAMWEVGARLAHSPLFPSCSKTIAALVELIRSQTLGPHLTMSLLNLAAGFGAAAIAGLATGVLMGRYATFDRTLAPFLRAFLAAPGLVYVPPLFTFFGASNLTLAGSVFVHTVFVIATTAADALRQTEPSLVAMAAAFGASHRQTFWKVQWPRARPMVVSGLQVSAPLAVKGLINGEMFIAFTGMGALVRTYGSRFEPDKVLALLIVIVAISLAASSAIGRLAPKHAS